MGRIERLPEAVANQIAAGEVVERPASAAKELMENALDAGATRIEVDLEGGGVELLRVRDDGHGMPKEDALLALERHATSKIRSALDLVTVSTLGFRGEALPSIASVCRFELRTRPADSDEGTLVVVEGGHLRDVRAAGLPPGTEVEVKDLFYNVPARRKFLKRPETEVSHVVDVVERLALAHPGVSVRLRSQGRTVVDVPRSREGEHRARVERVLGGELAGALIALPSSPVPGPVRARGYVGHPSRHERSLRRLYTFVNGRFVRDRTIQHAVQNAYRELLPSGRYPVGVIHLEIEPGLVDVNVHPQKTEVRFSDTSIVHRMLSQAVLSALASVLSSPARPDGPAFADRWPRAAADEAREDWTRFGGGAAPSSHLLGRAIEASLTRPSPGREAARDWPAPVRTPRFEPASAPNEDRVVLVAPGALVVAGPDGGLEYLELGRAIAALTHQRLAEELALEGRVASAPLLIPARFEAAEPAPQARAELLRLGFALEPFGGTTLVLKTAPRALGTVETARLVELLRSVLDRPLAEPAESLVFLRRVAELSPVPRLDAAAAAQLLARLEAAFDHIAPPWPFRLRWSAAELTRLLEDA